MSRSWGADENATIELCYLTGDATVDRFDDENDENFGVWCAATANIFADSGTDRRENALFTPSLSRSNLLSNAPSAMMIGAGDRTSDPYDSSADNLNFPLKIVRYYGMQPLPSGEYWGWPQVEPSYPLAAFHIGDTASANPSTLCFEDRDGAEGLHSYHDCDIERLNFSRRITAFVRIRPEEVEQLLRRDCAGRGLRAVYTLSLDGEPQRCTLEEVCDYNPEAVSTKCKFLTI